MVTLFYGLGNEAVDLLAGSNKLSLYGIYGRAFNDAAGTRLTCNQRAQHRQAPVAFGARIDQGESAAPAHSGRLRRARR